ncbi:TonB-dependent receptor plug domain-containing protein [Paracoccus mangrovi]|uniref:TonB-dependent receptor plug domain-containing protein n=1 Tax=Paracoccus mangrovi TaxID=1715645 RepID=A0ABV7R0F4_9RHOB
MTRKAAFAPTLPGTALLAAIIAPLPLWAQQGDPDTVQLDPVVITGGLTPIAADAYGRAHTVLTADEIERRGLRTVQDALRIVPGVAVSSAGASQTQVRIRGAEGNHTLILIDGVPATGGNDEYYLSGLETANIDRIEVLRGPQSVFYGSNASAGVINIVTRRAEPGTHAGGRVEVGNGYALSGWFSQRGERGGLMFTASKHDDHGYNSALNGDEKDGIDRRSLGLSGDWQASDALQLGFTLRRAREDMDYDSQNFSATGAGTYLIDDPDRHSRHDEFTGALWGEYVMADGRLVHRLEYQESVFKRRQDSDDETRGETRALKYRLSYGLDGRPVAEARHLLNLMIERVEDENDAAPDYARANNSLALEYRGFLENGLDIQAGLRRDDFDRFADFTSWNLGLSWQVPDSRYRLHASAGRGLVKPSYYELFADDAYTLGNPGLSPERNSGFDLGVEAELMDGRGSIDVTYFNEHMQDEISYAVGAAPDGRASYVNQRGESRRQGVEVAGQWQASDALWLGMSYTYLDAKNPDGSVEVRRPRHQLGLSARHDLWDGRGWIGGDIRHVAGNYDSQGWNGDQVRELPDYTLVNLSGGYDLTDRVRATARVVNLFDKEYSDVWGYGTQGRQAYLGLEAKW